MPETCTPGKHCGTHASGWLNGSHPNVVGQSVQRTVCFSFDNNCCLTQTTIEIINCGMYYVYNLPSTPGCYLAYCGGG